MKTSHFALSCLAFIALLTASTTSQAQDIYLNGVKVNNAISNQEFKNAKVRFDAKGNVYLTVEGIKVYEEGKPSTGQTAAIPADTYWLVATQTQPGMTQYDIEVHVNGKLVKRIKNTKAQLIMDIAPFLRPGKNEISYTAIKDLSQTRKSFDENHKFEVIVGRGKENKEGLVIEQTLARYQRTAKDVENHSKQFSFTVK